MKIMPFYLGKKCLALFGLIGVLNSPTLYAGIDNDGIPDAVDNCIEVANPQQIDTDGDGFGNFCDGDLNNDGNTSYADLDLFNQRFGTSDPDADFDSSGFVNLDDFDIFTELFNNPPGPAPDNDGDGIPNSVDNCIEAANPQQIDSDGDGYGNFCDGDLNNDGNTSYADFDLFQQRFGTSDPDADFDSSGFVNLDDFDIFTQLFNNPPGPAPDNDEDGIPNSVDNCIEAANPQQIDSDGDGYGNFCDGDLNNDGNTSFADLDLFKLSFGTNDPDADFDSSGFVNLDDFDIFIGLFRKPPGPSADND